MIRGGQSGAGGSWCWLVKIQCCRLKQGRRVWQWSHDSPYQNHTRLSHTQHHAFLTTQLVSVSVIQCQCITISHSQCSVQILFANIMPRHSGSVLFSLFHAFFVGPTLSSACPSEPFESRISSTFSFYSLSRFVPVQSNDLIWSVFEEIKNWWSADLIDLFLLLDDQSFETIATPYRLLTYFPACIK